MSRNIGSTTKFSQIIKEVKSLLFLLTVVFAIFACESTKEHGNEAGESQLSADTIPNYEARSIEGFQVFVEKRAFVQNDSLTNQAILLLKKQLAIISALNLNSSILKQLKSVAIFLDWNTDYGAAVYHPSEQWLVENGYYPGKAESIEISNLQNFISWSNLNQPFMILHELSHAYHHKYIGFDDARITNTFNTVLGSGLYRNVKVHNGNEEYSITETAYSLTNKKEYFAELTEAYFGRNDIFPFNKNELESYDTLGFNMIESVWQQD